jgi:hypothetical protein
LTTRTAKDARGVSPGLLFACVLGLLLTVTALLWTLWPGMGHPVSIRDAHPPSPDYYLAFDGSATVEHDVLYFGLDTVATARLRQADVLLLGNSRLMFAARPGVLDRFFEARGLRYYALGFGFREADQFPLAIIEKFDLRPRYVIVNADGFFNDSLSDVASETLRQSQFGARQRRWESEATHVVRRALHQIVPNWIDIFGRAGFMRRSEVIAYRARTNGTWEVYPWAQGARARVAGRELRMPPLGRVESAAARRFQSAMDARGVSLVLTFVPTPRPLGGGPALLADLLQVPLITAHPVGIGTHDGDHLDYNSAIAWSEALVGELGRVIR